MKIWIGPTGKTVRGGVLDVSLTALSQKLRDYDPLLYVRWNPKKKAGRGCWEIRRRPEKKCVTGVYEWEGATYCTVGYKEIDIVNHVLDVDVLHYNVLVKLREMDTFTDGYQNWLTKLHSDEKSSAVAAQAKAKTEMQYTAKQFKHEIKDFRELIASGINPALIADHWK